MWRDSEKGRNLSSLSVLTLCSCQRSRVVRPTSARLSLSWCMRWWSRSGSNRRHPACKAGALPAELRPRRVSPVFRSTRGFRSVVGLERFELSTPRLSSVCSNQLSYRPSYPTCSCSTHEILQRPARLVGTAPVFQNETASGFLHVQADLGWSRVRGPSTVSLERR
jgi:hypothetical protein